MRFSTLLSALALLTLADASSAQDQPRLVTQVAHSGGSASFSPDGTLILTTSLGGVSVWDVETGVEVLTLGGHADSITSAAFSSDGTRIVTGSEDDTALIWDLMTGAVIQSLDGPRVKVFSASASFSPDGTRVITSSLEGGGGIARVWDVDSGDELLIMPRSEQATSGRRRVSHAAFSPDGTRIATAEGRDGARLWETDSGEELLPLKRAGTVQRVVFSPEGSHLLTIPHPYMGEVVSLWDTGTGERVPLPMQVGRVFEAGFSPDGARLATASGNEVVVWDLASGDEVQFLPSARRLTEAAFSPDGRRIITSMMDGSAQIWDVESGAEVARFESQIRSASVVALSPDRERIAVGQKDGVVQILDTSSGIRVSQVTAPTSDSSHLGLLGIAFSPDGTRVVTSSSDGTARVWNAQTGDEQLVLQHEGPVQSAAFSSDGARIETFTSSRAHSWDAITGDELKAYAPSLTDYDLTPGVWDRLLSPDATRVAITDDGSTLRVLDITTGEEGALFPEMEQIPPSDVAFSPDGTRLVTGEGAAVRVWDVATGTQLARFDADAGRSRSVAFTLDGRHIVTSWSDGTNRLLDAGTGAEVVRVISFIDGSWLVVTPDGRFDASDLESISGAVWVAPDDPLIPIPIEAFMADYYEPRLLTRLLAGETFPDTGSLLDRNRVQPRVEITSTEIVDNTASVTVQVEGMSRDYGGETHESGVWDLRLFRDGQLVAWADSALVVGVGDTTVTFRDIALPASGAQADTLGFSAYAFNVDRVKSRTARADLAVPASEAPRRRAFVVSLGVDAFADSTWNLGFAVADARATTAALGATLAATRDSTDAAVYADVVTVGLVSDRDTNHGTAAALRGALLRLAGEPLDADAQAALAAVPGADRLAEATPDDVVIVTASTHGYADSTGIFYLLPSDIPVTGGRLTPELLAAAVSSDDLAAWLRGVDAGALALVVDACNAAGAVEGTGFKPGPMGARGLGQLAFDKGMAVLTATQAAAPALESAETGRGLLTFALVDNGLLAGQADGAAGGPADGRITLAEWLAYGTARVPGLYEEVAAGAVETFGRGGEVRTRSFPPDTALGTQRPFSGVQTPALFDFRHGSRSVVVSD